MEMNGLASVGEKAISPSSPVSRLLMRHDNGHRVFLTHIDRNPISKKKVTFIAALVVNILIGLLIVWRLGWGSAPMIVESCLYRRTIPNLSVFFNLAIDFFIFDFFRAGVRKFATGQLWFRLRHGFRSEEVVFRRFQPSELVVNAEPGSGAGSEKGWDRSKTIQQQHAVFRESLFKAMELYLIEGVAVSAETEFWVLDYAAMSGAYLALKRGDIPLENWDLSIWFCHDGQWTVRQLAKFVKPEYANALVQTLREKFGAMGRDDLLKEWTSRVRSAPNILPADIADEIFQREGLDFTKFLNEAYSELVGRD